MTESTTGDGGSLLSRENAPATICAALAILFTVFVRVRLLNVPLERDEGEYAYVAQLMLRGVAPYLKAYTMKLPGAPIMYAVFMSVFGETAAGIRIGLLLVNLLSTAMVFLLGRRLGDRFIGTIGAAAFAVLSLSSGTLGLFAHATNFLTFFALGGFLFLLKAIDSGRRGPLLLSGLCFGFAVMVKQHAAFLVLFALLYLVWQQRGALSCAWRRITARAVIFMAAALLPFVLCSLVMYWLGTFDRYWFWIFTYASEYASSVSLAEGAHKFVEQFAKVVGGTYVIWLAGAAGLALAFARGERARRPAFVLGLLGFSFLTACPGLFFRQHYFIPMLPAVALLAGFFVAWVKERLARRMAPAHAAATAVALLLVLFLLPIYLERKIYLELQPAGVSDLVNGANPFAESVQIAQYLRMHTGPDDVIAVLGSEPEIFFYSGRMSATGHIYMYGLMEDQPYAPRMQEELIREIEAAKPKYLVNTLVQASWLRTERSHPLIFDWTARYLAEHYRLVGVVDIFQEMTVYRWDEEVAGYRPRSNAMVTIYRRTD